MTDSLPDVVLVSMLPRGEPFGASALVALDRETQKPLAVREFQETEYLEDPELGAPGQIRHGRGIVQLGDKLFVALFNCVREYAVEDVRELSLRPGRVFTDPRAVDLHGICVYGKTLSAASTGTDSVISWDIESGEATVTPLLATKEGDVRFPDRLARQAGKSDWREVLEDEQHVNGVSIRPDGTAVVCSLTRVLELRPEGIRTIHQETGARMHDGCLGSNGDLLLTDAARGTLVSLSIDDGIYRCLPIANPEEWFVRGIGIVGENAYVLSSEKMPSRQRNPERDADAAAAMGSSFMVTVIDLRTWTPVNEGVVRLSEVARGSVAYSLLGWKSERAARD